MARIRELLTGRYRVLVTNVTARVGALVSLTLATLVVAWSGGPAAVGIYALLRVLPSLLAVVMSCGLPGAVAYFLAGPERTNRRLPFTILAIALAGGGAGALLWAIASPLLDRALFSDLPVGLVALSAALVLTRALVATAKSCSQGRGDLPGANRVIFTEEFMFLPAYGLVWGAGARGYAAVVAGLLLADAATLALAWGRLIRRGFFRRAGRPSGHLARLVASYGIRAQIGGVITLMNLRLDFIILNVLAGPAVLGVYAVASKFAELVKVLGMSVTYVLYPKFARDGRAKATSSARRLMPKAGLLTAAAVVPLWLAAGVVIPALYGSAFKPAVVPAQIILLGLSVDGIAAVITAYLYGVGRPGLNSLAMTAGLGVTVVLDLLLIPRFEAVGAATASAVAYVTSTCVLVAIYWWLSRSEPNAASEPARVSLVDG